MLFKMIKNMISVVMAIALVGNIQCDKIYRKDMEKYALFSKMVKNKKLDETILEEKNCDARDCAKFCIKNNLCKSFNSNKSLKKCQLLSLDRFNVNFDKYIDSPGWIHYDTERKLILVYGQAYLLIYRKNAFCFLVKKKKRM